MTDPEDCAWCDGTGTDPDTEDMMCPECDGSGTVER